LIGSGSEPLLLVPVQVDNPHENLHPWLSVSLLALVASHHITSGLDYCSFIH
jgi:hypothetical protein